ncbi:MAG: MFS transporter [Pseudomonadota bacterium]
MSTVTLSSGQRTRGIIACIAATTTVTVTLGISYPFLALTLHHQGVSPLLNGLNASVQMLAVMFLALLAPRLIRRFGVKRVIAAGMVGMAVALALLPVFPSVWLWFPIRFLLGLSAELAFTAGDVWINQLADERRRGRLIGVAGMFQHGGFGLGPMMLTVLDTQTWTALYIGIGIVLVGLVPLAVAGGAQAALQGDHRARIIHFFTIAPSLMMAGLMFGLIDSATLSLLPVYGVDMGVGEDTAKLMLTIFVVGAIIAQIPVGFLADRVETRRLMAACTFVTLLTIAALPFLVTDPVLIYPTLLLMGATLGSFYTIALTAMGRRFRSAQLVGATTSFMFLWAIGSVIGPSISGGAMDALGPVGMPIVGVIFCAIFLGVLLRRISSAPPLVVGNESDARTSD